MSVLSRNAVCHLEDEEWSLPGADEPHLSPAPSNLHSPPGGVPSGTSEKQRFRTHRRLRHLRRLLLHHRRRHRQPQPPSSNPPPTPPTPSPPPSPPPSPLASPQQQPSPQRPSRLPNSKSRRMYSVILRHITPCHIASYCVMSYFIFYFSKFSTHFTKCHVTSRHLPRI